MKAIALSASLIVHVAAVAAVGGHRSASARPFNAALDLVAIDVEPAPAVPEIPVEVPAPPLPQPAVSHHQATPTHHHDYPVAADHDARPHDPSLVHVPLPTAAREASPVVTAADEAPVRFTLPQGANVVTVAGPIAQRAAVGVDGADSIGAVPESKVSVPARLIANAAVAYPPAARQAEIEADVPVEIVVDEHGHVVDSRSIKSSGYGLDDAAARSIRAYHFSAALKDGRPVRVRMRWVVQFRLR
jgi:TonB family protein